MQLGGTESLSLPSIAVRPEEHASAYLCRQGQRRPSGMTWRLRKYWTRNGIILSSTSERIWALKLSVTFLPMRLLRMISRRPNRLFPKLHNQWGGICLEHHLRWQVYRNAIWNIPAGMM